MPLRRIAGFVALGAVPGVFAAGCRNSRSEPVPPGAALSTATFAIEKMTCASCNVTVRKAAERVAGVREARADFREKRAVVTYDPAKTTPAAIAAAIADAGYPAAPVEAGSAAPRSDDAALAGRMTELITRHVGEGLSFADQTLGGDMVAQARQGPSHPQDR
jgi:mercuric ion binding protein